MILWFDGFFWQTTMRVRLRVCVRVRVRMGARVCALGNRGGTVCMTICGFTVAMASLSFELEGSITTTCRSDEPIHMQMIRTPGLLHAGIMGEEGTFWRNFMVRIQNSNSMTGRNNKVGKIRQPL